MGDKRGWETVHKCYRLQILQHGDQVVVNVPGDETVICEIVGGKLVVTAASCDIDIED